MSGNSFLPWRLGALLLLSTLLYQPSTAHAQGTAFTYQGRLNDGTNPASGIYDLRFAIYNSTNFPGTLAGPLTNSAIAVSNGLFTVTLNFGYDVFTGDARWLEIAVRTNGGGDFTALSPRQPILPTPYAMHAQFAGDIEPGSSVSFSGPVTFGYGVGQPFYLAPGVTNLVANLNAQYLAGMDAGQFWWLGGNSGQLPGSYVLGTLDNNPLEFQANGQRALLLTPTSLGVNFVVGSTANSVASGNILSSIGGGWGNTIAAPNSSSTVIGGGYGNSIESAGIESVIGGGLRNLIQSNAIRTVIAGGLRNHVGTNSSYSAISGGQSNRVQLDSQHSVIAGGFDNRVQSSSAESVISGGHRNYIADNAPGSVISGGRYNLIDQSSDGATVAGGSNNVVGTGSQLSTIGVGWDNTIGPTSPYGGTIAGGYGNQIDATNFQAVIGGGAFNHIHTYGATSVIAGGHDNNVLTNASFSVIGGGLYNFISNNASYATIGGGLQNKAAGAYSTVPGGSYNSAAAPYSFAAGYEARALHEGSFVWSEPPTNFFQFDVGASSTASNQFVVRASGGIQVHPTTSMFFGGQTRQMLNLWGETYGIGVQDFTVYSRCANTGSGNDGFIWYRGGIHNDGYANAGGGTELMHLVPGGLYVNGTFVSASDRNAKENFKPVDARAVLDKVAALPLSEWNYKSDTASRHVGPMAQDFYAAFGVGPDDKHIATVDADGVALAAIQGLNEKVKAGGQRSEVRIQKLEAENAELKQRLEKLERLMNKRNGGGK